MIHLCGYLPDSFVRHDHSAFKQQLFDIPKAQAEPEVEPDGVADDLDRKAVILYVVVAGGVSMSPLCHTASVANKLSMPPQCLHGHMTYGTGEGGGEAEVSAWEACVGWGKARERSVIPAKACWST